jgi:hypothetical protein
MTECFSAFMVAFYNRAAILSQIPALGLRLTAGIAGLSPGSSVLAYHGIFSFLSPSQEAGDQ